MPAGGHLHRVARRLGLIGPKVGEEPASPPVHEHHEDFIFYDQKCGYFSGPLLA